MHMLRGGGPNTTLAWKNHLRVKAGEGIAAALASSEKRLQEGNWDRKIFQVSNTWAAPMGTNLTLRVGFISKSY